MKTVATLAMISAALVLSACEGSKQGPDEFGVLPTKPLIMPSDLTVLPEPSTALRNRADQQPLSDAVVAMGGKSERLDSTQINRSEQPLLAATGRFGVASNIRETLAAEDAAFRDANKGRILERAFGLDIYYERYEKQSLDSDQELLRLRRLGVRTPTATPPGNN